MKRNHNQGLFPNTYFWRSHQKQEIDYLEELSGAWRGYEIKWGEKRLKVPSGFNRPLVIDEAQRIGNIGLNLKLIVDHIEGISAVVTGSSSLP